MKVNDISRRGFLKGVGTITVSSSLAGRIVLPTPVHATPIAAGTVRFGVQTLPQHVSYRDLLSMWQEADELKFDMAFVFDHFIPIYNDPSGPCFEGWTLLSSLAAHTQRIKVGLLVTGNTYRHPAVLAKMAATVDHATKGRLILGLGAAWFEQEHEAYGIPFYTPGTRARRLGEAVEIIKLLFTQEKTSFNGKYYQLKDAPFEPKGVQKPYPPILIGGIGPKLIQPLIARHADIWHFFVRNGSMEKTRKMTEQFDALCHKVGRDPAQIEKSVSLRPNELRESNKAIRRHIRELTDVGVRHFILSLPQPDRRLLRRFAKEIMPAFHRQSASNNP
jgi:F420-dependent oxidoreductase-like protein